MYMISFPIYFTEIFLNLSILLLAQILECSISFTTHYIGFQSIRLQSNRALVSLSKIIVTFFLHHLEGFYFNYMLKNIIIYI